MPDNQQQTDKDRLKLEAAKRALEFVQPGMVVGLGSGTTATLWIHLLGEQVRDHGLKIRAIASSEDSEALGRGYGIPFVTLAECPRLDLAVDGADEIAPGLALIKGGGGKLLREKIVASAAEEFVIIADGSKIVDKLGKFPLPIEVIRMAAPLVRGVLERHGFKVNVRKNKDGSDYSTDENNLLFDCSGVLLEDPEETAALLDETVGIVEHGLFLNMATRALIAADGELIERTS